MLRHVCTRRSVVLGVVVGASELPCRRSALLPLSEGPTLFAFGGRSVDSWLVGSLPTPMAISADGVRSVERVMRRLARLTTFGEELTCFFGLVLLLRGGWGGSFQRWCCTVRREGGASRCGDHLWVGGLGVPLCAAVAVCLSVAIHRAPECRGGRRSPCRGVSFCWLDVLVPAWRGVASLPFRGLSFPSSGVHTHALVVPHACIGLLRSVARHPASSR